jgi:hypothetical protein
LQDQARLRDVRSAQERSPVASTQFERRPQRRAIGSFDGFGELLVEGVELPLTLLQLVDKHWDIAARRNRRRQIGNLDREPFPFVAHRFELRTRISYRADRAIDVQENWRAGTAIVCT